MTFAPSKMEHPSLRSQLFPEMTNKKLNLKNYKSRTGVYNVRNAIVKKDTKDIRYRHLVGTEFDMHAKPAKDKDYDKKLQDFSKNAKAGAVPRSKTSVQQQQQQQQSMKKRAVPKNKITVNPSQRSLISTLSGFSQGSGTITLTDDQLRTILSLVASPSNTMQNQSNQNLLPPIEQKSATTVETTKTAAPEPEIKKQSEEATPTIPSRSTTKAQINLPTVTNSTQSPKKDIPIAKVEPIQRKTENIAYASSFQIGGDGTPSLLDPIAERRRKAKEEWRLELQKQMKEQQERREMEKNKMKNARLGSADWHNKDMKSFKQQSNEEKEAKNILNGGGKNVKIRNSFEASGDQNNNNLRSSFDTIRTENTKGKSIPTALQQTTQTTERPHIRTNYEFNNQNSAITPGNTGFFSSPKDEEQRKLENRKKQQEELKRQMEENRQRKLELKKIEEEREAYEENRVRLECQILNERHQKEQLGAKIEQPSISKQIEEVLSPRTKPNNPGNFLNPENPNNPARLIEAQSSPRNPPPQNGSQLSQYQRYEETPLGDYDQVKKLPEIKKIDDERYKVKIDHHLLGAWGENKK